MTERYAPDTTDYAPRELLPDGGYAATLVGVDDGPYEAGFYKGEPTPAGPGVYLVYGIKEESDEGAGDFRFLRKKAREKFTYKGDKLSTLTIALNALGIALPQRGTNYDTDDWLGAACMVNVDHYVGTDGNVYNGVNPSGPLPSVLKKTMMVEAAEAQEAYVSYAARRAAFKAEREMAGVGSPNF